MSAAKVVPLLFIALLMVLFMVQQWKWKVKHKEETNKW
jgi:hypothetical protein